VGSLYQLNPIIRKIEKKQRDEARQEKAHVLADPPECGIVDGLLHERSWYRIDPSDPNAEPVRFSFAFTELSIKDDWRLNIEFKSTVAFSGSCLEDARVLLNGLKSGENFDRSLEDKIRTWITQFRDKKITEFKDKNGRPAEFVRDFLTLVPKLKLHVAERAKNELWLDLDPDLTPRNMPSELEVLDCNERPLSVTVKDYGGKLALTLTDDLRCIPGDIRPYLGLVTEDQLRKELREAIEDELRRNVTLHEWQFELQTKVKEKIEKRIDEAAGKYGRKGERLLLEGKPAIEGVQALIELNDLAVEFEKSGYPEKVKVGLAGLLDLKDLGKLAAAPVRPDGLVAWLTARLRDVASSYLLDVPYVDLFGKYDDKLKEMKEHLRESTAVVGYTLKNPVVSTNLDFEILREGVVTIEQQEMTASLIVPECQVKLEFDVHARIVKEALSALFEIYTPVKKQLGMVIQSALEGVLRKIDPGTFYVEFQKIVVPALANAARATCAAKLGCTAKPAKPGSGEDVTYVGFEMAISFNYLEDDLQRLFHSLRNHDIAFENLEEPNTGIRVDASCHVAGIAQDGWLKFWRMKPSPEKIEELVRVHVKSSLNDLAKRFGLNVLIDASDTTIKAEVQNWVNGLLGPHVGLYVEFFHWVRHDPEAGQPLASILAEIDTDRQTLTTLIEERASKEREGGYNSADLTDLETRINTLKTRINKASRNSGAREMIKPEEQYGAIEAARKQELLSAPKKEKESDQA